MHRIRVYVDTSVFGGTQDDEFVVESNGFFEQVRLGAYVVLLSDETQRELAASPEAVQDVWLDLPAASVMRSTSPRPPWPTHPRHDHPQPEGGGR